MLEQAFEVMKTKIVDANVTWENQYEEPTNGVTHSDRRKFFTNYNKDLVDKVSECKNANS